MLNYVNGKIPNKLESILLKRSLTASDLVRMSGLSFPTVKKIVEGGDCLISKLAVVCDTLGISLSDVFGDSQTLHQESHGYDQSQTTMIGYSYGSPRLLQQRIQDLEEIVSTKDKLIKMYEEKLGLSKN